MNFSKKLLSLAVSVLLLALLLGVTVIPAQAAAEDIAINEENFPDAIFRSYVAENIDTDGDGYLSQTERDGVTTLDVRNMGIASLQGLEYFPALQSLDCSWNQLTELDVSQNPALVYLSCSGNQLTELDVSQNPVLQILNCGNNQLTELDVSKNPALWTLSCFENRLTELDVSQNPALEYLSCSWNQLTQLDMSQNPALVSLGCSGNQLTELNVSQNPALVDLSCSYNQLTELDVSQNPALYELSCRDNQLTELDVSQNPALYYLNCYENQLTSLNLGSCAEGINVDASGNIQNIRTIDGCFDLTTLPGFDVSKASNWSGGTVNGNVLTVPSETSQVTYTYDCGNGYSETFTLLIGEDIPLDETNFPDPAFRSYVAANFDTDGNQMLSPRETYLVDTISIRKQNVSSLGGIEHFPNLKGLFCQDNNLASLDVSHNLKLTNMNLGRNKLTALDVSKNTELVLLTCDHNQLTELDVSKNAKLITLGCEMNAISQLDVSNNLQLQTLACTSNQLSELDVTMLTKLGKLWCNGNQLTKLDVSANTALKELHCENNQLTELDLGNNTALIKLTCGSNQLTSLDVISAADLTTFDAALNCAKVSVFASQLDLATLPGFDVAKASNWSGGTVSGNILTVPSESSQVTYTYDCGNGYSEAFTLKVEHMAQTPGALEKAENGNFYYYVNGVVDTEFVGLVENDFGTWYIKDGMAQLSYDGLAEIEGTKHLIKGGRVSDFTGITKQQGVYYYFGTGINDLAFEGLVYCNGMLAYVENGEVNFNKTGVVEKDGQLHYVKYGIWRNTFKGLTRQEDGNWIYMAGGVFDLTYTGVAKLNAMWVYVADGYVSFTYTGSVDVNGVTYQIKYGVVQFS